MGGGMYYRTYTRPEIYSIKGERACSLHLLHDIQRRHLRYHELLLHTKMYQLHKNLAGSCYLGLVMCVILTTGQGAINVRQI